MLSYMSGKFLASKVNTNAYFLDEEMSHSILQAGLQTLVFSADAAELFTANYESMAVWGVWSTILSALTKSKKNIILTPNSSFASLGYVFRESRILMRWSSFGTATSIRWHLSTTIRGRTFMMPTRRCDCPLLRSMASYVCLVGWQSGSL